MSFPIPSRECLGELARHNREQEAFLRLFAEHAPHPRWHRDGIIDAETRFVYENWLPQSAFLASLRRIARVFLPAPDWMPQALLADYPSLPDFWSTMSPAFCGRLTFREAELLPLFCSLADPPRFGTDAGRYPRQLADIRKHAAGRSGFRLLDIGCGIGLNTLEIASAIDGWTTGITREPLEVWMAQNRTIPHDPTRETRFASFSQVRRIDFKVGDINSPPEGVWDGIVCNGLIGGRFFHETPQFDTFLAWLRKSLVPGGCLRAACSFHEGFRQGVDRFRERAGLMGFRVEGSWRETTLTLP